MKRFAHILFLFVAVFSSLKVEARNHGLIMAPVNEDEYSWRVTDASQKKQAVGMTMTGFVFFVAIVLISGFTPSDLSKTKTAPQTTTETSNTILGGGSG